MKLDPRLRRHSAYLYVQELLRGTVVELGSTDERSRALLVEQGAQKVDQRASFHATGLPDASADVVLAVDVPTETLDAAILEARRILKPSGVVVIGCDSKDRPGAKSGVSYYDLVDKLSGKFGAVTMVGQAPFAGATLVEYGVKDPEPLLDGTLVEKGERVEWYIAVAGQEKISAGGYAVVQVPIGELKAASAATVTPATSVSIPAMPAVPAAAPPPKAAPAPVPAPKPQKADVDVVERVRQLEKAIAEFQTAALAHKKEADELKLQIRERDGLLLELELDARQRDQLRANAKAAESRALAADLKEREIRKRLAEVEGMMMRGGAPFAARNTTTAVATAAAAATATAPVAATGNGVAASGGDVDARLAALEAENAKLRVKEEEARSDSWKHMKARSEAEAAAAEVREDTVRKLKDARKLASVELMRATEEAMKKAVTLREELERATRDRKEQAAELNAARAELELLRAHAAAAPTPESAVHERDLARAREEGDAAVLAVRARAERTVHDEEAARQAAQAAADSAQERTDRLHGRVVALERELDEARRLADAERERSTQLGELVRRLESEATTARDQVAAGAVAHGTALEAAQAERERFGRMLGEVEAEAKTRADAAVRLRQQMKERDREVEALRHELTDRDAKLVAMEKQHPPADEMQRMEAELAQSRTRLADIALELQRKEAAVERAAAAAAHERARAERLVAEERRAVGDRNDARARAAEAEARVAALAADVERLLAERDQAAARALDAENESKERKERSKQLKRELEDAEQRVADAERTVATLDEARERLQTMEDALRGEEQRMAVMEEALRRAAAEAAAMAAPTGPVEG